MQPKWKTLEEQVRGIAELIYGAPCRQDRIAGVNFDAVIKISEVEIAIIEISVRNDLEKVREGVNRLVLARSALAHDGILLRGYIVLSGFPSVSMEEAAKSAKMTVLSASQLAMLFFRFPEYRAARVATAFGSSIDPLTGAVDTVNYIPVTYKQVDNGRDLEISNIVDLLLSGRDVVVLGEYGSGKSRCVREIFFALSEIWSRTFQFPFAVNLRDCWGLQRKDEIIRRGVYVLGMDHLAQSAVRALNRDSLILLLDGFDELGSQAWSSDEGRLRQIRARALSGVKDLVSSTRVGCLIAGREHYFSSNEEMMSAIGVSPNNTVVIRANNEFNDEQLAAYFDATGIDVELPTWLPRKPLICQTISSLSDEEIDRMLGSSSEGVIFWNHFIEVVCQRDARINAIFDPETIYKVFVSLSRITRTKSSNVGPISQRELQDAFEAVLGQLPVEEASAMLQRLPSLGRIGTESQDRQFVDMFILDGLRAKDVAKLVDVEESERRSVLSDRWANPLQSLGQNILAHDMIGRSSEYVHLARRSSSSNNTTLSADIVSSLCRLEVASVDLEGIKISGGTFSELDLSLVELENLVLNDCTFERLVLPGSPPRDVQIVDSMASRISGAASISGLPSWVKMDLVEDFDQVSTISQIRRIGLSQSQEILVAVLKKTFKQKGSGRKEEALTRGFRAGTSQKISNAILSILLRERILTRHKGDEGWIYSPSRGETGRITKLLDELRSSKDAVWIEVSGLS